MSADACGQFGLELASYSPSALERLQRIFPSWMTPGNRLDVWPAAFGRPYNEVFHEVAGVILEDPNVGAMMIVIWSSETRYRFFEPVPEIGELIGALRQAGFGLLLRSQMPERRLQAGGGRRGGGLSQPRQSREGSGRSMEISGIQEEAGFAGGGSSLDLTRCFSVFHTRDCFVLPARNGAGCSQ